MPYSITCSNKIFTLVIAPFSFIFEFLFIICESVKVPGVYIQHNIHKKRSKPLLHHVTKVVVELEKHKQGI